MFGEVFGIYFDYKTIGFDLDLFDVFLKMIQPAGSISGKAVTSEISFRSVSFAYPDTHAMEQSFYAIIQESLEAVRKTRFGQNSWLLEQMEKTIQESDQGHTDQETNGMIFSDFTYTFVPGRIYGIVGKNGAGKTTLMALLSGFFRSYSGEILFDGSTTRDWTGEGFAQNISTISQSPYVYGVYGDATIRNNLTLGITRTVTDEEIYTLLAIFGLDKKIKKASKGLDSEIRNDVDLS